MINLHTGVAIRAVDDDPAAAKAAMATAGTAARRVLGEISDLLATLRAPGEVPARAPGLGRAEALIAEFEASGLQVTARLAGDPDDLPGAVDRVAYRVLQEALTNAHKHGSAARAHVWIERNPAQLRLIVTNPAPMALHAEGHGLAGIRERVASVGGTLDAAPDGDEFRVEAVLPLRPAGPEAQA